jgi:hypothetical protein
MAAEFCVDATSLRAALAEIEAAEKNGFFSCLAVFRLDSAGPMLSDCRLRYSDLFERAHPSDGRLNWGRYQGVTRRNRFKDGKLVPIKPRRRASGEPRNDR